jgi:hypothetical protein
MRKFGMQRHFRATQAGSKLARSQFLVMSKRISNLSHFATTMPRSGAFRNMGAFLRTDLNMNEGMKNLVEQFYRSITTGTPVPIPYREILLTATILNEIFAQLDVEQQPVRSTVPRAVGASN